MSQDFKLGDYVFYTGASGIGVAKEWLGLDGVIIESDYSILSTDYVTVRFYEPPMEGVNKYTVRRGNVEHCWDYVDRRFDEQQNDMMNEETERSDYLCDDEDYVTITEEAHGLVYGDRNADYGHPHSDYTRNAAFLQTILGDKLKDDAVITPQDVIMFMITLKVSRLVNDHTKRDSIVDIAGYAECLMRVNRREAGLE